MGKYFSMDTEATGLTLDCVLIEFALVPVDSHTRQIREDIAFETLVQCRSYEELAPSLNDWVRKNNEGLIRKAHAQGVTVPKLKENLTKYLNSEPIKKFFAEEKRVFLGKSLSALDLPLLHRTFGEEFMHQNFHHHTLDITCFARACVDARILPEGHASTSKIIKYFGIREDARHTALSDAVDMAQVYFKLLDLITQKKNQDS